MIDGLDFFRDLNLMSVSARLILATLLGSVVGIERANKRYAAGIRTFALVSLGAALSTIMGLYFAQMSPNAADISRIPSQLLCGIGFLGAGTIKGLTTAAGLWVTAAMGIAIGAGMIGAAIVCFFLILITNYYMHYMTRYVENHTRMIELYIELEHDKIRTLIEYIKKDEGCSICSIERRREQPLVEDDVVLRLEIDLNRRENHKMVIQDLLALEGVHYVEELS